MKAFIAAISCICVWIPFSFAANSFDDLSANEIKQVVKLIKDSGKFSDEVRFPVVRTQEPKKSDWLLGQNTDQRIAYAAIFDFKKTMMTEVLVDLKNNKIISTKDLPNIRPPIVTDEYILARKIIREDPRWQEAIKRRGLDPNDVTVDLWAPGLLGPAETKPDQRLIRGIAFMKKDTKNIYSRPVEGIVATADLVQKKVTEIWDEEMAPVAPASKELNKEAYAPLVAKLKPLTIKQSDGPSFKINGQEITWHNWKFRYSMNPLNGLQLLHLRYTTEGVDRSVIYKISLSEMLVPYGTTGKTWTFRNAFDVGEYGLGKGLHPLVKGQDVPDNAVLLESAIANDSGDEPYKINGAAIYERPAGILWKHRNQENGDVNLRKARQLVLTFMTAVGNYDYGVNYILNLDGSIQIDVQLTGILLARGTKIERNPCDSGCIPLVEKNILAPPHQHFFNFRIDFDIDGEKNFAAEMNVNAAPKGKKNPEGNVFGLENTVLTSEKKATREHNFKTSRHWKVFSTDSRNKLNHPRGYALVPGEIAYPYLDKSSTIRKRAGFIDYPIWFTAYKDDETSAAALYPTTAPPGEGLPKYIKNDESLEGKDVVVWYTFGVTHIPHPEEWPIMNAHHAGFKIKPLNFFSQNPTMNLDD